MSSESSGQRSRSLVHSKDPHSSQFYRAISSTFALRRDGRLKREGSILAEHGLKGVSLGNSWQQGMRL